VDTLNILWKDTNISHDGWDICESIRMKIVGDKLIHSRDVAELSTSVISRNIFTGEVAWEWLQTTTVKNESETGSFYAGNKLLLNSRNDHYAIDITNGQQLWHFNHVEGEFTSFVLDDFYITSNFYWGAGGMRDSVDIKVCDINTGVCDMAFRVRAKGQRLASIRAHSAYKNSSGDLILIIGVSRTFWGPGYNKSSDLIFYNYTQDSLVWEVEAMEGYDNTGLLNISGYPKIEPENNRVYVMTSKNLFCYHLLTGEQLWRTFFPNTNMLNCNYIVHGNKLLWVDDMGYLIALDKYTGDIIYREDVDIGALNRIDAWGDKCIIAQEKMHLVDLNTGKILRTAWLPSNGPTRWYSSPLIDEANNRMYFTDGYAIICAEIPDTWKE
jgi:outer membrane protein assembly factor BamB